MEKNGEIWIKSVVTVLEQDGFLSFNDHSIIV